MLGKKRPTAQQAQKAKALGRYLAAARIEAGLTQSEVMVRAGYSVGDNVALSHAETGSQTLKLERLTAVARVLNLDVADLLARSNWETGEYRSMPFANVAEEQPSIREHLEKVIKESIFAPEKLHMDSVALFRFYGAITALTITPRLVQLLLFGPKSTVIDRSHAVLVALLISNPEQTAVSMIVTIRDFIGEGFKQAIKIGAKNHNIGEMNPNTMPIVFDPNRPELGSAIADAIERRPQILPVLIKIGVSLGFAGLFIAPTTAAMRMSPGKAKRVRQLLDAMRNDPLLEPTADAIVNGHLNEDAWLPIIQIGGTLEQSP